MNHIETKIVLLLSNRLAAAPESREKIELIEELTDNLYQKYQELITVASMDEDQALDQVMESLGDVNELVDFLIEESSQAAVPENQLLSFEQRAEKFDVSHSIYEAIAEKWESSHIHSIRTDLKSTDLEIQFSEADSQIHLDFDGEDIEVAESEDGVLFINRIEKKSSSFFSRFLSRSTSLTLTLPAKPWQRIALYASSGDITIDSPFQCQNLEVTAASGDIEISSVTAPNAEFHTASGDITLNGHFGVLSAGTASGDVTLNGHFGALSAGTASGDVELILNGRLPDSATVSTASGDCSIQVPEDQGFHLNFETNSGEFCSKMPFNGIRSSKHVDVTYLNGGSCEICVSSSSGDFEIDTK